MKQSMLDRLLEKGIEIQTKIIVDKTKPKLERMEAFALRALAANELFTGKKELNEYQMKQLKKELNKIK